MAEENFDIFSDFQEQDFKNSQEYFDYLKKQSEDYRKFKTSPEQVQRDKDAAIDALKFLPNVAAETGNLALNVLELPLDIFDLASGAESESDKLPRIPTIPYRNPEMEGVDDAAALAIQFMSPFTYLKGIDILAKSSPKVYKVLSEAHPYFVKQMYEAYKKGGLRAVAETGILPSKEVAKKLARNFSLATGAGLADRITGSTMAENIFPQPVDMPVEKDNVITIQKSDLEADSPPNIRGSEYFETKPEVVDRKALGGEPGLATNIFEEDTTVAGGPEEIQVANLVGKTPIWAIAGGDKSKTLTQEFTKAAKKAMEAIKNKIGTKDEVLGETIEDVIDTPPASGTGVGSAKTKKTIIDSPEPNEGMFYSELEARLMDPNTPKQFKTADEFLNFLQAKQISKAEVDDNILTRYIELSKKNNYPLVKEDMLEIIRQSPMRSIDTITYGNPAYGGTKNAKYPGYQEPGALPDSYREDVLYLPANKIPFDPDKIPGSVHDFEERYVIGWSRKTDRKATLPVEKTPQGIEEAVDPAMIRTLKRNQKKLDRQLKGLETSAIRKLEREGVIELDDVDNLTMAEIRNILDTGGIMARLRSIDEPLEQQILQFRMKMDEDAARLKKMEATTKGQEVTITFADEIQSDILQQAKQMEQKFREELGDLMDKNIDYVKEAIRSSQAGFSGHFRNINPEIAEYFIKNKSVFRPIFQNETEMQQFMNKYAETQIVLEDLAKAGLRPDKELVTKAKEARATQQQLLADLETAMSKESLQKLFPNVPFKNRMEWGSALIKRDLNLAAERLYGPNKVDGAAEWYVVTPANPVKNRYGQSGGTAVPVAQRTKNMKGIGTEEFYGGPESVDPKGKHYTSTVEKILKKAAKENNSEIKIIEVPNVGKSFAIKITPEMLLPHKTHRKKGGVVYTPELIDIFEVA